MPVSCFIWLVIRRPIRALPWGIFATAMFCSGLTICHFLYGPDFFFNLRSARVYDWDRGVGAVGELQWIIVGLIAWIVVGFPRRSDPGVRFCNLFVVMSLLSFILQRTGDGVAHNAQFELDFALSIALGLAFFHASKIETYPSWTANRFRTILLLAILVRLLASSRLEPIRLWIDPTFHSEIAFREAAMQETVVRIRLTPGDIDSNLFALFRAEKPFVFDSFNVRQRLLTGRLPAESVENFLKERKITFVLPTPGLNWFDKIDSGRD